MTLIEDHVGGSLNPYPSQSKSVLLISVLFHLYLGKLRQKDFCLLSVSCFQSLVYRQVSNAPCRRRGPYRPTYHIPMPSAFPLFGWGFQKPHRLWQ